MGHYVSNCPEWRTEEAAKPNPFDKGYANHVHLEGAYNEPGMENGTSIQASSLKFDILDYLQNFLLRVVAHPAVKTQSFQTHSSSLVESRGRDSF